MLSLFVVLLIINMHINFIDVILSTISSGFATSEKYPSMVLVLEHLDALCPRAKSTGQGYTYISNK